ncbi:MAG: hypothetical protein ACK4WH_10385 [Phycisphaerales bacterium]
MPRSRGRSILGPSKSGGGCIEALAPSPPAITATNAADAHKILNMIGPSLRVVAPGR